MAHDIRAYVAEVHDLVTTSGLQIADDSRSDKELKWAVRYADQIDPLTAWRKDIEKARVEEPELCPKCGKIHGVEDQ